MKHLRIIIMGLCLAISPSIAERIQFVSTSGQTLTYEALSPDGLTVRTVAGTSLPETASTGYYTVSDGNVLIGDAVIISNAVRVIGGGVVESNFNPAVDVVARVTLVDTTTANTDMLTLADIADAIWDELLSGHTTSGSASAIVTFIRDYSEGDTFMDTTTTPWQEAVRIKGTTTDLTRKNLTTTTGGNITSQNSIVGNITEP